MQAGKEVQEEQKADQQLEEQKISKEGDVGLPISSSNTPQKKAIREEPRKKSDKKKRPLNVVTTANANSDEKSKFNALALDFKKRRQLLKQPFPASANLKKDKKQNNQNLDKG